MKRFIFLIGLIVSIVACKKQVIEKVESTYDNGDKKKVCYYEKDGDKEVIVEEKQYHKNGEFKMGGKFKEGLRDGEWKAYFDNGKLQSEGFFKSGKREGMAKVYFPNGQLMYEGQYKDDKQVGHWKFYNEQGKLVNEKEY